MNWIAGRPGRIPIGAPTAQPGARYGAESTALTVAQLPPHTHTMPALNCSRWIASFNLAGPEDGFDADADGESNGYEWATGTNPTNVLSFVPLAIRAIGSEVRMGFTRNLYATDVTIHLQYSAALNNPRQPSPPADQHAD